MNRLIVGPSLIMALVDEAIVKASRSDKNVLILGETGTGKDLAARRIHELSARCSRPFVAINCANLFDGLLESELFGHAKGSFTGAVHEKTGLVDAADNGTVFMDEIGEMPLALQAKILRLLDKKESRKIGATQVNVTQARFIFATNRDLYEEVIADRFRKDLYYRINVIRIRIPSLRERKEDIPEFIRYFLERENSRYGTKKTLDNEAMNKLMAYSFPGNVRELENIVERSMVLSELDAISTADIKFDPESCLAGKEALPRRITEALELCRWNKTKTAHSLGKSRRQLYRLLEKYQMNERIRKIFF